jgi:hypothetical protein
LWKIKIGVDNSISIQNYWSDKTEEIRVVVASNFSKSVYAKDIILIDDNWKTVLFPDGFELVYGDSLSEENTEELTISLKSKREVLHKTSFTYDPSLNTLLQLDRLYQTEKLKDIWGSIIDAYTWDDRNGKNIFVRSILNQEFRDNEQVFYTKYLYMYHFIEEENDTLKLVRKFTDSHKNCEDQNNAYFNIESIELTDINRDTIGEISVCYDLLCSEQDTVMYTKKVLLTTDGKKFMVDAEVDPCSQKLPEINSSLNLNKLGYFDRFLRKKLVESL